VSGDMYQRAYWEINTVLDRALGTEEEDGAGQGIVADVMLLAQRYADLKAAVLESGNADWRQRVAEIESAEVRELGGES
jgi:hypothetical protein